jgi:hypothetical protein
MYFFYFRGLFCDDINISVYVPSNGRNIGELLIGKNLEGSGPV